MAPELDPNIEVIEIKSPGSPEEIIAATRGLAGKILIKVLKVGGGMAFITLLASCSPDGGTVNNEVEHRRQALWETTNTALCTKKASGPNPPQTVINQIETAEDEVVPGGTIDMENVPTIAKKFMWGKYALEKEQAVGQGPHTSIYMYDSNMGKEKIGVLEIDGSVYSINEDGILFTGEKVYQLTDTGETITAELLGDITLYGPTTYKNGFFLVKHVGDNYERKLAAIDANNPSQTLKDIVMPSNESFTGSSGIDYDSSTGTLSIAVEDKIYIYKNLPEGIDWMDNADDYLEYIEVVGDNVQKIYVISGYTFAVNGTEIIVISPVGQVHSINTDDINGSTLQSFEEIGGRLHVVASPSFSVAPWPDPSNPDFPYLIIPDPGPDSSNYTHCTAVTQEFIGLITPPDNPEPEDDVIIDPLDVLEEIGVDTEIYPDIDPADVLPDTPIEDLQPDVPTDTPTDVPIDTLFDIEDPDTPQDLIQETFDTLDLLADGQFDQFVDDAEQEIAQPDANPIDTPADLPQNPDTPTTPDTTPTDTQTDKNPETDAEEDFVADAGAFIEEDDNPKGGKDCSTAPSNGVPMTPEEAAGTAALGLAGLAGLAAARRKEEYPVPAPAKKKAA